MTEDQIKAIAEEYVNRRYEDGYITMKYAISNFLRDLSTRYCIVEREKVTEEYEAAQWHKETAEGMNIQYGKGMASGQIMTLENLFGTSMFNQNEAQYTPQCETCMHKIGNEVLVVCKDSSSEHRHCVPWGREKQDYCLYKIYWEQYPESYWQTILTPEQFAKAKSLNQNEE